MIEAGRHALRIRLQLVRSALQRCEDGEYGECVGCGESIGHARLSARPETPFCLACQEQRERRA
jgi:DnaK suppressor protein